MSNVIGLKDFKGMANGDVYCWLCQKPLSTRAVFCHVCGTVQPVRDIDHFVRLGLDRCLDVDLDVLDRNYQMGSKALEPERFFIRGMGEKGHAAKHREILQEAYETLRDPVKRGRYWLHLNKTEGEAETCCQSQAVDALRFDLGEALDPTLCDRVAQRAGQFLEQSIKMLMQALRQENWGQAKATLNELQEVSVILDEARKRRESMRAI